MQDNQDENMTDDSAGGFEDHTDSVYCVSFHHTTQNNNGAIKQLKLHLKTNIYFI